MFFLALLVAMASPLVLAYDPSPLQDICVADKTSNGTYLYMDVRAWGVRPPLLDFHLTAQKKVTKRKQKKTRQE